MSCGAVGMSCGESSSEQDVVSLVETAENEEVTIQSINSKNRDGDPSDPEFYKQWYHYMIHDKEAWKKSTDKGVTVAVIENEFDMDHPDLAANIVGSYDATGENDMSPAAGKYEYEGSSCAGIIAALKDNGIGGCGVAPDAYHEIIEASSSAQASPRSYITVTVSPGLSALRSPFDVSEGFLLNSGVL